MAGAIILGWLVVTFILPPHLAGAFFSFLLGVVAAIRSLRNRGDYSVALLFLAIYLFEPLATWIYWIATYKVLMSETFPSPTNFLLSTETALLFTAPIAILVAALGGLLLRNALYRGLSVAILVFGLLRWAIAGAAVYYLRMPADMNPFIGLLLLEVLRIWLSVALGLGLLAGPLAAPSLSPPVGSGGRARPLLIGFTAVAVVGLGLASHANPRQLDIEARLMRTITWENNEESYGIASVAWSPDGALIAAATTDAAVRIWSASDGKLVQSFEPPEPWSGIDRIAWSPDGQRLAAAGRGRVSLWRVADGTLLGIFPNEPEDPQVDNEVLSLALAPNTTGTLLVAGERDKTVRLWLMPANVWSTSTFTDHRGEVTALAFHPSGDFVVSGSALGELAVWQMPSGELTSMTRPKGQVVNALLFSPDGTTLAVSVDRGEYGERHGPGTAELWRVEPGARLSRERSWEVPENYVAGVIFRSDGRILAVTVLRTAYDRFIRLWDIDTGARYQLPIKESCSDSIAPSPDGTTLAVTFECFGWEGVPPTSIALWKLEESPR